jgi:hypothetical protein
MGPNDIIAIVVVAGCIAVGSLWVIGRTIIRALELRRAGSDRSGEAFARIDGHDQELARMRDRIAVLERLLTDDDRKLAREIERLDAGRTS